jgi:hypothetical protein
MQSVDVSSLQSTDLGMQAYFLGHWPAAVDLLRSVPAEARSPLQWLHLARALVKLGNLVEAWDSYNELEDMGVPGLSAEGWQASLEVSQVEAAAVKERIPWAHVHLSADVPEEAAVFVDQDAVSQGRLRAPYPLNPGWHTFLVEYQGEVWAARRVYFQEGQQLPVLLLRAPENPLIKSAAASRAVDSSGLPGRVHGPGSGEQRGAAAKLKTASYISFGVGALATGVGIGFAIRAVNRQSHLADAASDCVESVCSASSVTVQRNARLREQYDAAAGVATGGFIAGAVGLATGGILLLLGHRAESEPPAMQPIVGLGSVGVAGRF